MRSMTKNKKLKAIDIVFILTLLIGIGAFWNANRSIEAQATTAPYDNETSADGVRIEGWRSLKNMTTYGRNNDNGCGYTAMAVLCH